MPNMTFTEKAWGEYLDWQSDKTTLARINALLKEIQRTPFTGIGKPEPLKHGDAGNWSRRINGTDRLVYRVSKDGILILQCKGHYDN